MKSSEKYFTFSPAFYLITCLKKSPKNFEKVPILKIWQLVSFGDVKTQFGETSLKRCIFRYDFIFIFTNNATLIVIVLTKSSLCCILIFLGSIKYPKDKLCNSMNQYFNDKSSIFPSLSPWSCPPWDYLLMCRNVDQSKYAPTFLMEYNQNKSYVISAFREFHLHHLDIFGDADEIS